MDELVGKVCIYIEGNRFEAIYVLSIYEDAIYKCNSYQPWRKHGKIFLNTFFAKRLLLEADLATLSVSDALELYPEIRASNIIPLKEQIKAQRVIN